MAAEGGIDMMKEDHKMAGLSAPESFWAASKEKRAMVCGGCGAGKLGNLFVPDTLWGLNVTICCDIHDWRYRFGATIEDKNSADRELLNNMLRWIEYKTDWAILRYLRNSRALKYYEAVQAFGGPAFWKGKNRED